MLSSTSFTSVFSLKLNMFAYELCNCKCWRIFSSRLAILPYPEYHFLIDTLSLQGELALGHVSGELG